MYYQSVAVATSLLHLHDDKIQQNFSRSLRATPESTLYVVWSKVAEQYLREETYRIFKGEMIIVRITRINEYCNNTRNIYFAYSPRNHSESLMFGSLQKSTHLICHVVL